jgi:hypothetical protein
LRAGPTASVVIRPWAILAQNNSNISFRLNFVSVSHG